MITLLQKFQTDAWRTAGARYNAARRLRRREFFATVSLALMSALTVAVAFIQRVYATPSSPADNYLSTISASLGVLLLTVSLIEWGAKTGAMAEALHQNAEKLSALWRRMALSIATESTMPSSNQAEIAKQFSNEYEQIKADCLHNHEFYDDEYFRLQHKNSPEFSATSMSLGKIVWLRWQIASIWYIAGLWTLLLILALPLVDADKWKICAPPANSITKD